MPQDDSEIGEGNMLFPQLKSLPVHFSQHEHLAAESTIIMSKDRYFSDSMALNIGHILHLILNRGKCQCWKKILILLDLFREEVLASNVETNFQEIFEALLTLWSFCHTVLNH